MQMRFSGIRNTLFFFLLLFSIKNVAQPFQKMYNYGVVHEVVALPSSQGFLLTGDLETNTNDRNFLLRTDAAGNRIWGKFYRDFIEFYSWGNIIQPSDSGYFLAGMTFNDTISNQEISFSFLDTTGNLRWTKRMGNIFEDDEVLSLLPTPDHHFLLCGYSKGFSNGQSDVYLINTDSSGTPVWSAIYGSGLNEEGKKILPYRNGYVLFGTAENPTSFDADVMLFRIDSAGNLLEANRLWAEFGMMSGRQTIGDVIRTSDNGFALCGYSTMLSSDSMNAFLVKMDSDLHLQFSRTYTGFSCMANTILEDNGGGYIIGGSAYVDINKTDAMLLRTDAGGRVSGLQLIGDSSIGLIQKLNRLNDSTVVLGGSFTPGNQINPHLFLCATTGVNSCIDQSGGLQDAMPLWSFVTDSTMTAQSVNTNFYNATVTTSAISPADTAICDLLFAPDLEQNTAFSIYPNPAVHELSISSGRSLTSLRIFDLTGRVVLETSLQKFQFDLPSGIYTLVADILNQRIVRKLIVK